MNKKSWLIILIIIVAGLLAVYLQLTLSGKECNPEHNQPKDEIATVVKKAVNSGVAKVGGVFTLIDQDGITRNNTDFKGRYMIVYFGYSYCPDICPAALNNISNALNKLPNNLLINVRPIFITIDPRRDDIKKLKLYMQNYHSSFIALTGDAEAIGEAVKNYRVSAQKEESKEGDDSADNDYLINHSSIVYLMDRQGRFVTSFNHLTSPDEIVSILKEHVR